MSKIRDPRISRPPCIPSSKWCGWCY